MKSMANAVKDFARSRGADLVGIAPIERFAAAPDGHRPWDILGGAKSVVACAMCIPSGLYRRTSPTCTGSPRAAMAAETSLTSTPLRPPASEG
jgi:hypothetical protein